MAPPDAEEYETQRKRIEELKAELATMRYKINNYEQDREMERLQHDNELRDIRRKADDDFKQRQAAEGDKAKAQRQQEAALSHLHELKETSTQATQALEKKVREYDDEVRLLKEQLEDFSAEKEESDRMTKKRHSDLQTQISNFKTTIEELRKDGQSNETLLQQIQDQLTTKDKVIGDLEAQVLRLKAQTGDAETIAVIRRELGDQVQHIRSLEAKTAKQHAELSHLRQVHKAVEVVEEEKRSLQRKLEATEALETELSEARIQRQRLEDERLAWTAYLQNASENDDHMELDTPEAVVRALVEERYNSASLADKLGKVQPEVAKSDAIIKSLENDKRELRAQIEKVKTTTASLPADKARARMERQRDLAVKEAEYLRAQLKTFDAEDETFEPEKVDQQKVERITELQGLVDNYRAEVQTLHKELSTTESPSFTAQPVVGSKRGRDEDESEQLGELNRKRRALADELSKTQTEVQVLQKENSVLHNRLQAAESQNKTRILSLRSNPTSDHEAVKASTLKALKEENTHLLSQLQKAHRNTAFPVIPASQLAAAKREVEEARKDTASAEKKADRLKKVWAAKSQEFKEAIFSTLGWTVTFMPNGKMRVESIFYPSKTEEHENSIVFDGERGTMKVSGGPQSKFAEKIMGEIKFWVRERGSIPAFLAQLTINFFEEMSGESTKALRM
jgi:mitotic spindle assembly checkpoint protein MAD1